MKIKQSKHDLYYETEHSAGFDIKSTENVTLSPGKYHRISTGLSITSTKPQEALLILSRSGLAAKHGVTVLNAPGLVDADYPNEIKVILINHGDTDFEIKEGDRIAQGLVIKYDKMIDAKCKHLQRRDGFGSTGV